MALPAASIQTAGMKKPTVNAARTARVGVTEVSEAIMNENRISLNGWTDIEVSAPDFQGGAQ